MRLIRLLKIFLGLKKPKAPELPYRYFTCSEEEKTAYRAKAESYQKACEQYVENATDPNLHYDCIVDDIFLLLGAFTFEEQVEKEIKNNVLSVMTKSNGDHCIQ